VRFALQNHAVLAIGVVYDQAHALYFRMAASQIGDLFGMNEHSLDFCRLIGAAHPAAQADIAAAARRAFRQDGRQITGGKTDQGVVGIEGRDDNFTDLTRGDRIAGAGSNNLEQ